MGGMGWGEAVWRASLGFLAGAKAGRFNAHSREGKAGGALPGRGLGQPCLPVPSLGTVPHTGAQRTFCQMTGGPSATTFETWPGDFTTGTKSISYMISGTLFHLSGLQSLICKMGIINVASCSEDSVKRLLVESESEVAHIWYSECSLTLGLRIST